MKIKFIYDSDPLIKFPDVNYLDKKDLAWIMLGRISRIVLDKNLDWEQKYDLIFSKQISRFIYDEFKGFDHYDPDTSYEEDVMAFYNQFNEYTVNLR